MTLADRLNQIIAERHITKTEFAARLGVTKNYIYILTGASPKKTRLSPSLAKLIASQFGYSERWIQSGEGDPRQND